MRRVHFFYCLADDDRVPEANGGMYLKRTDYEQRTEELLAPILTENGFELVDVEYVKEGRNYYLRAYIDKPGGITIDDCELVSRALEAKLDAEDLIPGAYILEVSSPGLGRALKKDRDFARSLGEEVEVHLYAPEAQSRGKDFVGVLTGYDADSVTIENESEEKIAFQRKNIASIRLTFDF